MHPSRKSRPPPPAAEREGALEARCQALAAEVAGGAARLAAALRGGEADQATIASLRKDSEKAWKLVEANQDKVCRLGGRA